MDKQYDGSGFYIGQSVHVDDWQSEFYGKYLGTDNWGMLRIRDESTGDVLRGSIDYVEAA